MESGVPYSHIIESVTCYLWHIYGMTIHADQAAAAFESIIINGCDTLRDGHGGQAAAVAECIRADVYDAVGDGHVGQATAARESRLGNAGETVRYFDGGQTCATRVFATCCVSEDFN